MYLSPFMDKIGKSIQMTKNIHGMIQAGLLVVQMLNGFTSFVPDMYKVYVAATISALQGIIAVANHFDTSVTTTTDANISGGTIKTVEVSGNNTQKSNEK